MGPTMLGKVSSNKCNCDRVPWVTRKSQKILARQGTCWYPPVHGEPRQAMIVIFLFELGTKVRSSSAHSMELMAVGGGPQ
jgi:hypothetical protein